MWKSPVRGFRARCGLVQTVSPDVGRVFGENVGASKVAILKGARGVQITVSRPSRAEAQSRQSQMWGLALPGMAVQTASQDAAHLGIAVWTASWPPNSENGHFHIWAYSPCPGTRAFARKRPFPHLGFFSGQPRATKVRKWPFPHLGPLSEQPCPGAGAFVQKMAIPTSGLYWLESQLVTELRRRPFPHLGLLSGRFPHLGLLSHFRPQESRGVSVNFLLTKGYPRHGCPDSKPRCGNGHFLSSVAVHSSMNSFLNSLLASVSLKSFLAVIILNLPYSLRLQELVDTFSRRSSRCRWQTESIAHHARTSSTCSGTASHYEVCGLVCLRAS